MLFNCVTHTNVTLLSGKYVSSITRYYIMQVLLCINADFVINILKVLLYVTYLIKGIHIVLNAVF